MEFLELFWSFFQVGLFSFGGGYAAMPLIQAQVVDKFGWLSMSEFTDVITISPVSYTHLDVYKRQLQWRGAGAGV